MFFRRISRMKRREKEYKNLKMKGGVLSVWFKIKNIKSFNRHPPGCYQKIRENILKCQSYSGNCTCASDFSVSDAWCTLFCSRPELRNRKSMTGQNRWQSMLMIHGR